MTRKTCTHVVVVVAGSLLLLVADADVVLFLAPNLFASPASHSETDHTHWWRYTNDVYIVPGCLEVSLASHTGTRVQSSRYVVKPVVQMVMCMYGKITRHAIIIMSTQSHVSHP